MTVQVSVVVPTYRRASLLRVCLTHLLHQSIAPDSYEVIVADDGAEAEVEQLVSSLPAPGGPQLRYVPVTATQGPAAARNAGWRAAQGEIIAFTDDDCQPSRDWLMHGLAAIANADAVTGRTIVPLSEHPTDFERNVAGLATAEFITANCFVRRAALEELNGFDERFTLAWREDSDLHFALLSRGKRIVKCEHAVVVHPVRSAPWAISLRQQRQGVFDPLLYRKHPQLYRQRIPPLPRIYYLAVLCSVTAVVALACQAVPIAGAALLVWLAITSWLTMKRLAGTAHTASHIAEMAITSAAIPLLSLYWRVRGTCRYRVLHW